MIERDEFRELERQVKTSNDVVINLQAQVGHLQKTITELVTKAEFAPVRLIAYGLATAVMSSVMMAVLAKVIIK